MKNIFSWSRVFGRFVWHRHCRSRTNSCSSFCRALDHAAFVQSFFSLFFITCFSLIELATFQGSSKHHLLNLHHLSLSERWEKHKKGGWIVLSSFGFFIWVLILCVCVWERERERESKHKQLIQVSPTTYE